MLNASGVETNEFLEYKNRPLVRKDDDIYYGDLSDKYYIYMMIMSKKGSPKGDTEVPDIIMVQLLEGATKKIEKQQITHGLSEAFEFADAWLTRFNK